GSTPSKITLGCQRCCRVRLNMVEGLSVLAEACPTTGPTLALILTGSQPRPPPASVLGLTPTAKNREGVSPKATISTS
ncbi:hypothetical protein HAX54_052884, partial [Datura stramonium]|nr:hypothetical protein [Datura stramonium]